GHFLSDNKTHAKNAIDEILSYYKVKSRELPDNIRDFDEQLEYLMHPLGIMRRKVRLTGMWYKEACGAMLAMKKEGGLPVALIPRSFSGYAFFDEKTGKYIKINKSNANLLDTEAICFYKPLPLGKINTKDLLRYMSGSVSGYDFFGLCLAAFAVVAIGLVLPSINNIIYSDVIISNSYKLLFAIFTFLFCTEISQILTTAVQMLLSARMGKKISNSVHTAVVMRLLSLPSSFFKKRSAGEIASNISNIGQYVDVMVNAILTTGISAIFSAMYITQMVRYGHMMAVYGLLVILLTILLSVICMAANIKVTKKATRERAREEGLTYSLITGIQKIKLSGAEKRAFSRWAKFYTPVSSLTCNPPLIVKLGSIIPICVPLVGTLVIYYSAIKSGVGIGDFFAFNIAFGLVMGTCATLIGTFRLYAQIKPTIDEILPILEAEPEIAKNKTVISRLMGGIEINNVSFKYSDDTPFVLDNLSLKICSGQYVAIVGESGCGKSTLMRLMLGFEKPVRGAIYYDGKDVSSLDLKSLRRNIGTVMQNEKLFQGNVFSNITISAPQLTIDEAMKAAEMAGVADDIKAMTMGIHTMISDGGGGGGISGGQRQRIIIARAIASNPQILMFDEATSALDNITQKTVSESLESLKCTRIVIAHRLSTIKNCDRIVMLDKGKISEDGTYEELIKKDGV
ncbi:MAG: ATP-binding cassette domain-containing protein, partial [Oscillospiraceae bacterium]